MPRKSKRATATDEQPKVKEDGRITFVRLGEPRLAAVLKRIDILKNVARYPHSERQSKKVMDTITEAMATLAISFAPNSENKEPVSLTDE